MLLNESIKAINILITSKKYNFTGTKVKEYTCKNHF